MLSRAMAPVILYVAEANTSPRSARLRRPLGLVRQLLSAWSSMRSASEAVALDELRRQLEVNVVGQLAVTQAVLPRLRESQGRVVFISSVSGRISTPWTGAYNASKFALEGMADSLRIELRPWKVKVILVEPAATDTSRYGKGRVGTQMDATEGAMSEEHRRLYAGHMSRGCGGRRR